MTDGLVVGSAASLPRDLAALGSWYGLVVAVNAGGYLYPGAVHHWATLHPEHLPAWQEERGRRGLAAVLNTWSRRGAAHSLPVRMQGGSSGLYAVEVALHLGCTRIVLAGVPLNRTVKLDTGRPWKDFKEYRQTWRDHADEMQGVVFSLSGWSRNLLGPPKRTGVELPGGG